MPSDTLHTAPAPGGRVEVHPARTGYAWRHVTPGGRTLARSTDMHTCEATALHEGLTHVLYPGAYRLLEAAAAATPDQIHALRPPERAYLLTLLRLVIRIAEQPEAKGATGMSNDKIDSIEQHLRGSQERLRAIVEVTRQRLETAEQIRQETHGMNTLEQYAEHFPHAHQCGHQVLNGHPFTEWANGEAPGTPWHRAWFCGVCHRHTPRPDTVGCPACAGESTVLLADGTVGTVTGIPEVGEEVTVDLHDENGNGITMTGRVVEILETKEKGQ